MDNFSYSHRCTLDVHLKGRRQMEEEGRNWERVCDAVALLLHAPEKES